MVINLKKQIDFYIEFNEWYLKIIKDFKFDYQKDCEARENLSQILKKKSHMWNIEHILKTFKSLIREKSYIMIYGCGPSLENTVNILISNNGKRFFNKFINLAADGASLLLKEKRIPINAIFTDLDGITKDEFVGSDFIMVHAHGDNIDKLKYFEEEIIKFRNIIGTTQVEPLENLINPGGFTDGDRILSFLRIFLLPRHKLFLIGMDFKNIVGKYSKLEIDDNRKGTPIKIKKLRYAVKILEWLLSKINNEVYFVNSELVSTKFNYLSIEEFEKMILF